MMWKNLIQATALFLVAAGSSGWAQQPTVQPPWSPNPATNASNPYTITTSTGTFNLPAFSSQPAPSTVNFCNTGANPAFVVMGSTTATVGNSLVAAGVCKLIGRASNTTFSAIASGGSTTLNVETGTGSPQSQNPGGGGDGGAVVSDQVSTNAQLVASPTTKFPRGVWRMGVNALGDAPPSFWISETGTCVANGFVSDVGFCNDAADSNSWVAVYSENPDLREWAAFGDDSDVTTAVQNAANYSASKGACIQVSAAAVAYKLTSAITWTAGTVCFVGGGANVNSDLSRLPGAWFHLAHTGVGFFGDASAGTIHAHFDRFSGIGTYRDQPAPTGGWTPCACDFDFRFEHNTIIEHLLLQNPTKAIYVRSSGTLYAEDVRWQPLSVGIQVDRNGDALRINNVHAWPYWSQDSNVYAYSLAHADVITLGGVSGSVPGFVGNIFGIKALNLVHLTGDGATSAASPANMIFNGLYADATSRGFYIDSLGFGLVGIEVSNVIQNSDSAVFTAGSGIEILSTTSNVKITNFTSDRANDSAIKVGGTGNLINLTNASASAWDRNAAANYAVLVTGSGNLLSITPNMAFPTPASGNHYFSEASSGVINYAPRTASASDPTVTNDQSTAQWRGATWINTATGVPFTLVDPTNSAARWVAPTPAKNLLLNGGMSISQVNAASAATYPTNTGIFMLDGWRASSTTLNATTLAWQQLSASPPAGFQNYITITTTTGGTVDAGDQSRIFQFVEGNQNVDLAFGLASAKTVTLSFWVKSSASGTMGFGLQNAANNRSFIAECVIPSATWTYCSATIPGDTAGTWVTGTTAASLSAYATLVAGSTFQGTAGAWSGSNVFATSNQSNFTASDGETVSFTGFKLEPSPVPTQFISRDPSSELLFAQRYYRSTFPAGTAVGQNKGVAGALCVQNPIAVGQPSVMWDWGPPMRATPTITTYNPSATNANWRDVTAGADVTVSVDPSTAKSASGVEIATGATTATLADNLCIHASADARL